MGNFLPVLPLWQFSVKSFSYSSIWLLPCLLSLSEGWDLLCFFVQVGSPLVDTSGAVTASHLFFFTLVITALARLCVVLAT